jgi:hypothetical protein
MKVTGNWRKLHTEELHYMYRSPYIVWVIQIDDDEMCKIWASFAREGISIDFFSLKPDQRRPFGRVKHKWEAYNS